MASAELVRLRRFESLDITGDDGAGVEVQIRQDGKVLWINALGRCVLRICKITGSITVNDERALTSEEIEYAKGGG